MKSNLSGSFFGCKKFLLADYNDFKSQKQLTDEQIAVLFVPYTDTLSTVHSVDNSSTLLPVFCEFIRALAYNFYSWSYQKLSCVLELAAHVFEHSFQKHLTSKQSFEYFSQIVVRHSLFRPPHSVNILNYEQAKQIRDYWLDTFVRYYEQYRQCFESELNEIIESHQTGFAPLQAPTVSKKEIPKQDIIAKFGTVLNLQ